MFQTRPTGGVKDAARQRPGDRACLLRDPSPVGNRQLREADAPQIRLPSHREQSHEPAPRFARDHGAVRFHHALADQRGTHPRKIVEFVLAHASDVGFAPRATEPRTATRIDHDNAKPVISPCRNFAVVGVREVEGRVAVTLEDRPPARRSRILCDEKTRDSVNPSELPSMQRRGGRELGRRVSIPVPERLSPRVIGRPDASHGVVGVHIELPDFPVPWLKGLHLSTAETQTVKVTPSIQRSP